MSQADRRRYEVVIGLEVHTHLAHRVEALQPRAGSLRRSAEPQRPPDRSRLPGVLPVLNERVVELAIRLGPGDTFATVNLRSVFARKNYFYPDLPKGYQISQFEEPWSPTAGSISRCPLPGGGSGTPRQEGRRERRIGAEASASPARTSRKTRAS